MQFSLVFLCFIAVLLPLFFALPRRARPYLLLAASVVFYAFAGWRALIVLTVLTLWNYLVGYAIGVRVQRQRQTLESRRADGSWDKPTRIAYRDRTNRHIHAYLALGVALDVALLVAFKLSLPTHVGLTAWTLPLGLSFVTLSAIAYLCDVSRGQVAFEKNPLRFALFTFYFPQMWQGPIHRYGELAPQLASPLPYDGERVRTGLVRSLWGCLKKMVLADTAGVATAALLARQSELGGAGMLVLIPLYTLQIYADFTGGMDVALGISSMLGIELYENFDRPFSSTSLAEYWRRWHRSLGRFFTDYVYYPLSLCRPLSWLSRHAGRRWPLYVSVLVTWALTGLWHGFSLNFAVWGLCNGVFLLLSRELAPLRACLGKRVPRLVNSRPWQGLLCLGTLLTAGIFRTLDLNTDVGVTLTLWGQMLTPSAFGGLLDGSLWASLGLNLAEWGLLAFGVLLMWAVGRSTTHLRSRLVARPVLCGAACALMIAAILVFGRYGADYDASQFIYGQF